MTTAFPGFSAGKTAMIDVPEPFFTELLPKIDNLAEMKVTLYALWFFNHQEGSIRYIREDDFSDDVSFLSGLDANPDAARKLLADGLERAVQRNTLIKAEAGTQAIYFLNSPRGRAAITASKRANGRRKMCIPCQSTWLWNGPMLFNYTNKISVR